MDKPARFAARLSASTFRRRGPLATHRPLCRIALLALTLLALLLPPREADADIARPVHQRVLTNGLHLAVCPDPDAIDVSLLVRYDTGSRDEPGGLLGLAHLVEHLMFTGSKHVGRGTHFRLLEQAGASNINGTTAADVTLFYETLPPERLSLGLWLESDRMGYLLDRVDEAVLAQERATVLNEYHDRITDVAFGETEAMVRAELFPEWHPYQHVVLGRRETIERITLADVRAFVSTWYGPANATVVIAGKVDPIEATALVERYFGALPARLPPVRPTLPALPLRSSMYIHVGAGAARGHVRAAWVTPRLGARGDAELDLAAVILTERLQRRLMGTARLVDAIGAEQRSMRVASIFNVVATVAAGHTPVEVLGAIDREISRFDSGVEEEEMRRARRAWYNTKLYSLQSSIKVASMLASALEVEPLLTTFDGRLGRYSAITPEQVRATARAYFVGRPRAVTLGQPVSRARLRGELLALEERAP